MRRTASDKSVEGLLGNDPKAWLLHDVIEEHFEELEFCVQHFLRTHDHPLHTFRVLANGIESRLHAHLDALVLAGPAAVRKLAAPLLEELDPRDTTRVTSAVLALAQVGRADDAIPFFEHELPEVRAAAAVGGSLAGAPLLDALARAQTAHPSSSPTVSGWLELLGLRGLHPANLFPALISKSEELLAAALLALRGRDSPAFLPRLEELIESTSEVVRERALSLALAWRAPRGWSLCERQALDPERAFPFSMSAYAMLGGPHEHLRLLEARRLPTHCIHVLRALGVSGNPAMVPALLEHLGSKDVIEAKVAAHSISAITGLDLTSEDFESREPERSAEIDSEPELASGLDPESDPDSESLPPLDDDDLEANLLPPPEDDLPRPDRAAIGRWWMKHESSMKAAVRHIRGKPFTAASLLTALDMGPLGLRARWASVLAIRSGGQVWLNTRAVTGEQRRALADARSRITQFVPTRVGSY